MKKTILIISILLASLPLYANDQLSVQTRIMDLQRKTQTALRVHSAKEDIYRLNKANAWLDMALDEAYEKDSSGIAEAAINQAEQLLNGDKSQLFDTPIVAGSEKIRDDIWQKSASLKQHKNADCAMKQLANLDVALIWAGHEKWESGWTHAKPYIKLAESLADEAEQEITACSATRALKDVPPLQATASATVISEKFVFETDALFQFDKSGIEQIVAGGQAKLDELVVKLKGWKTIEQIKITGYTDRLGKAAYNDKLSLRRAENVRQYLMTHGLPVAQTVIEGKGELNPLVHCNGSKKDTALIACLQANRRVEITVRGENQ